MTTGETLRALRISASLTQVEVARRFGCDKTLISAYENGRREPAADQFLRLVAACSGHVSVTSTVEAGRDAAAGLEQVAALAMTLPRRAPGTLRYPPFHTFRRR